MNPSQNLKGRVAVVTGASSGIGEASARLLASRGAAVALIARRADRLETLAASIRSGGGTALAIALDVTDAQALGAAASSIARELGAVDLVVNNAGVMLPSPLTEHRMADSAKMIDLNLTAAVRVIDAFVDPLVAAAARGGTADLINVSSIAASMIFANFAVYSATKAAITHLSKTLRAELGPQHVRVSVIEPGLVETELQGHMTDPAAKAFIAAARSALTWLRAEDIAEAIAFTAGLPRHVNLQQLTVMPTQQA